MSSPSSTEELLREIPFAAELPEKALAELTAIAQVEVFPEGTVLFTEGDEHQHIYLIGEGKIVLDMRVPGRGDVRILSLGGGDVLGWSPLIGDRVMTATATVQDETRAVVISGDDLYNVCEADHEIGYRVMQQMAVALSRRLVATRLQLLDLFQETTPGH